MAAGGQEGAKIDRETNSVRGQRRDHRGGVVHFDGKNDGIEIGNVV